MNPVGHLSKYGSLNREVGACVGVGCATREEGKECSENERSIHIVFLYKRNGERMRGRAGREARVETMKN